MKIITLIAIVALAGCSSSERTVADVVTEAKTPEKTAKPDTDAFIFPGAKVKLHMEESDSQVFVATDKANYDRMLQLIRIGDMTGLTKMTFGGQVLIVKRGTKALIIDSGMFSTEVRVLEGPHTGESGLVKTVWIRKL